VLTDRQISPQDLVLSADIRWIASSRVKERTTQAQQLINFLNILGGVDPNLLAADGTRVKFGKIIKLVASVGLDLPEVEDLVEDVTQTLPDTSPELEHALMAAGRTVVASPVSTPEIHRFHIESHFALLQMTPNELLRMKLQEHISSHFAAAQPPPSPQQGGGDPSKAGQGAGGMADLMRGMMSQVGGANGMMGSGGGQEMVGMM
jgi:hypothetical protein